MFKMNKTSISIVVPAYNEEKNILILYQRLKKALREISNSYEIIIIDDGSKDNTLKNIQKLSKKDKKVKGISFSRNFGHMSALSAGIKRSTGKKVALIDADLQDPPEVIPKMWKKSNQGYEVVYGIKKKRKEGAAKKILFDGFYKILETLSNYKMPSNVGTFSLIDRRVVEVINNIPEKNKYLSGLRAWVGFKQTGIIYEREKRSYDQASSFKKLFKLASDAIFSFSYIPLRIASIIGIICATIALIGIIAVIMLRLFFGWGIVGWASTLVTILLFSSIQLITLGIIGEYLARIYDEVKNRPEYVIKEMIGLSNEVTREN
jgi:dolichol-phosphate mannosyltransferase